MFTIGIDPHKGSHTATVLDPNESQVATLRVEASHTQSDELIEFAAAYTPRVWAVEGASGLGNLLAQQLLKAGETVVDVPPALSARARLLDSGNSDKTDSHDARSAAVVAMRNQRLRQVTTTGDTEVLRMLCDRRRNISTDRTRALCRLHALLCLLVPAGYDRHLNANRASAALATLHPQDPVGRERKRLARDLVVDVRRFDTQIDRVDERIVAALRSSPVSLSGIHGAGPVVTAIILGRVGDVTRFPTAGHFARYNGTAPIEASSGPRVRHRLNLRGDRQLNYAMHVIAVTQIAHDTNGRAYYRRKIEAGATPKEALRALKRHISNAVYNKLCSQI